MSVHFIVGAAYRPPAKALLSVLSADTKLVLRPEPSNEYDPNAVQVLIRTSDIHKPETLAQLHEWREVLANYGFELEEILLQPEWHLGYIPRTQAPDVAATLDGADRVAKLGFAANGKPLVEFES